LPVYVYATVTPINFRMDKPPKESAGPGEKDIDRLYFEAVNYGANSKRGKSLQKGEKGPSVCTTVSTKRFELSAVNLQGFKAKIHALPAAYEKASLKIEPEPVLYIGGVPRKVSGDIAAAEQAISRFKQFAKKRLEQALNDGVRGYDNCVAVIDEINANSVTGICKVEFFLRRTEVERFEGAGLSKHDGLWHRTDKVRKFYSTVMPTVALIEGIISSSLLDPSVAVFNDEFVFRRISTKDGRKLEGGSISMTRVGYDALVSPEDRAVSNLLTQMRRPKT